MADLSDVEAALVSTVATALGTTPYTMGASAAAGISLLVGRGWPLAASLDAALTLGQAYVTVWSQPNSSRDTTRFGRLQQTVYTTPLTLSVALNTAATQVTFSGTCTTGQVVGLTTSGVGYAYRMLGTDTPSTVATAFAALIPGATASGAVLSIAAPNRFTFTDVVSDTTQVTELRRQTQIFHVIIWAPTPAARDLLASLIDPAISLVRNLTLPDTSTTDIIKYRGSVEDDVVQKTNMWKRTLRYETEYATTQTATATGMLFATVDVLTQGGTVFEFGTLQPGNYVIVDQNGNLVSDGVSVFTAQDSATGTITGPIYDQNGNLVTTGAGFVTNQ
jgi:hypothetical protein